MRPLKIALIHRRGESSIHRLIGPFSYAVPDLVWSHFPVWKGFDLNKRSFRDQGFDLIIHEDHKAHARITVDADIPYVYIVRDSTLSEGHYKERLSQAGQADLVLVDWDDLKRFESTNRRVRRWSYCVNDSIFFDHDLERSVDVGFFANINGDPARGSLNDFLHEFCEGRGYIYQSGSRQGVDYARAFATCKIAINANRTPTNRNHRIFDAMASGTCLLTEPVPEVSGEVRQAGKHYVEWSGLEDLATRIPYLLSPKGSGRWKKIGRDSRDLVKKYHTWTIRAHELRQIITEEFPWIA